MTNDFDGTTKTLLSMQLMTRHDIAIKLLTMAADILDDLNVDLAQGEPHTEAEPELDIYQEVIYEAEEDIRLLVKELTAAT